MNVETIRLKQCKENLEKCERERCDEPQKVISAIEELFDLVADSANDTIKMEASHSVFNFILNGSYFTEDDKKTFLKYFFEEGCRRLRKGFLNPTIH